MAHSDLPAGTRITYSQQFRRCNKPDCSVCRDGARGHGPYWYAYWREEGRLRSRYVGKRAPPTAELPDCARPALDAGGHERSEDTPDKLAVPVLQPLRVRTLGGFAVWRGEELIPPEAWTRRMAASLFKCLLAAPDCRVSRETILEWLWPEEDPATSIPKFRLTLHRLRRTLASRTLGTGQDGAAYLRLDDEVLLLDPAPGGTVPTAWLDANAFERAARSALAGHNATQCRAALALYTGDYLPDDVYDEWTMARRERLHQLYITLLLHLAALCERNHAPGQAIRALRSALEAEPGHEQAARALMRLLAANGRTAAALRTYHQLAETLRRSYDLAPDAHTQAQYSALLAAQAMARECRTNAPASVTSFVGRHDDLSALILLLGHSLHDASEKEPAQPCRLLTLTGAGGCGKTRLAVELGRQLLDAYADGVWLVELASLSDAELIAQEINNILGIAVKSGQSPMITLIAGLAGRELLLVLDNCEHLIGGCAALVGTLLQSCPSLRILATSREALGVLGEIIWRVSSLDVPNPQQLPALRDLVTCEAVRLFVERAQAVQPSFTLTAKNAQAVASICHQLDGIPLALELAAARLAALSVDDVAARLDDRFRLLSGGNRAAEPRHQTLRAVLDWSYALLSEGERLVLQRLAVFAGSWNIAAAEAVCADGRIAPEDVLDVLGHLTSKSLIQQDERPEADARETGTKTYYRMLETVRQYAAGRLRVSGEEMETRRRHLMWYIALAEQAETLLSGTEAEQWLALLNREHDNLRAALGWAGEHDEIMLGLRLAGAITQFWSVRGYVSEGRQWLEGLLRIIPAPYADIGMMASRAKALNGAGLLAGTQGDHAQAIAYYDESLALYRNLGDTKGIAQVLSNLGLLISRQGDHTRAMVLYEESLVLRRELGDTVGMAAALNNLGGVALATSQYARARAFFEESLALYRQMGIKRGIAIAVSNLGYAAWHEGAYAHAAVLSEESLVLRRELGDQEGIAIALTNLGEIACLRGDLARAAALQGESLALFQELGETWGILYCLQRLALVVQAMEQTAEYQGRSARLFGALAALRTRFGIPLPPNEHARIDPALTTLRGALGDAAFEAAWTEGCIMDLDQASAYTLAAVAPLLSRNA